MLLRTLACLLPLLLAACATAPVSTAQKSQSAAATRIAHADNAEECEDSARTGSPVKQKTCHAPNTSSPNVGSMAPLGSVRASTPGAIR